MDSSKEYLSTAADWRDMAHPIADEHGVIYSKDGKKVLRCENKSLSQYTIREGTEVICDEAFTNLKDLTCVVLPNSVIAIGKQAFYGCSNLMQITIPDNVKSVGDYAFAWCVGLTKITIGHSLTDIGNHAFLQCTSCVKFDVANSNKNYYSEDGVLFSKDMNILVDFPHGSSLLYYEIPSIVTKIGTQAFYGCPKLMQVTIPESVTAIGGSAFEKCASLSAIVIPNSVTSIGDRAFAECVGLISVKILNSVTPIGNYAFEKCSGLTEVAIGNSVTSIGEHAFQGCSNLTSLIIPDSVTNIGEDAFGDCSSLTEMVLPSSVTIISRGTFNFCLGLRQVTIPNSVTMIGEYAFHNCPKLAEAAIGKGVTKIGDSAFMGCTGLTSITIPNSVTEIGSYAFRGCTGLTSITIPEGVTSIGSNTFSKCTGLTRFEVNKSNKYFCSKDGVLYSKDMTALVQYPLASALLPSFDIPDGVTSIGNDAFQYCMGLTKITIPNSVTTIGEWAFRNCTGLTEVTIPNSVTLIGSYAFDGCTGLTKLTIGNSVTKIGGYAFSSCTGLTSITIPNSVERIGENAFYGCTSLKGVIIGDSVTSIGEEAFWNCPSLSKVLWLYTVPFYTLAYTKSIFPSDIKRCILYVPQGLKRIYSYYEEWGDFNKIQEIENAEEYTIETLMNKEDRINNFKNCITPVLPSEKIIGIKNFLSDKGVSDIEELYCDYCGMLGFINYTVDWHEKFILVNRRGEIIGDPYDKVILLSVQTALCKRYKEIDYLGEYETVVDEQLIVDYNGNVLASIHGSEAEIEDVPKENGLILLKQNRFTESEIMQVRYYLSHNLGDETEICPQCNKKLILDTYNSFAQDGRLVCSACGETILGCEIKDFINYIPLPNLLHILSAMNFSKVFEEMATVDSDDFIDYVEHADYYDEEYTTSREEREALKYLEKIANQELFTVFSVNKNKILFPFQPNSIVIDEGKVLIQTAMDVEKGCKGHQYSPKRVEGKYIMPTVYLGEEDMRYVGEVAEHVDYTFVNGPCLGLTLLQAFKNKPIKVLEYLHSKSLQLSNEAVNELIAACRKSKKRRGLLYARDKAFVFDDVNSVDDEIYAIIKYKSVGPTGIVEMELLPYYHGLSFYDVFSKDSSYIVRMVQSGCLSISNEALEGVSKLEGYSELLKVVEDNEREEREQEEYEKEKQEWMAYDDDSEQANRDFEDMMNDFDAWGNID